MDAYDKKKAKINKSEKKLLSTIEHTFKTKQHVAYPLPPSGSYFKSLSIHTRSFSINVRLNAARYSSCESCPSGSTLSLLLPCSTLYNDKKI